MERASFEARARESERARGEQVMWVDERDGGVSTAVSAYVCAVTLAGAATATGHREPRTVQRHHPTS
eukprot:2552402-Rhodomonas_salina.2